MNNPTIIDIFVSDKITADRYEVPGYNTYLTNMEARVVKKLVEGDRAKEIAFQFGSSLHTVNTHLSNIKSKLNCESIFSLGIKIGGWTKPKAA